MKKSQACGAPSLGILIQHKLHMNILYKMYMNKNPSRTPLNTYVHVVSALYKALGSSLFKMGNLKHGHL
jgi:hypothetical protein